MNKIVSISILFLLFVSNIVFSVPSEPWLLKIKQSDGKDLEFYLKGDEKVSWGKTIDGYTLLTNKEGDYTYAIPDEEGGIMPSNQIAHSQEERDLKEIQFISKLSKDLFFSKEQISIMKQVWEIKEDFSKKRAKSSNPSQYKMIVILMQFQNLQFTYSQNYFNRLFNEEGFNLNGNEGSIKDYFNASLAGNLEIVSTVVGPYTASNNYEVYGQALGGYNGARVLLMEGINAADPFVNYADFCNNSNYVDCVYMIFAGYAASGGSSNTIWPHRSSLQSPSQLDGVFIYDYACSQELNGNQWYPMPPVIGTICHEFSHVLGLADHYDTDYNVQGQAFDSGEWDLMASGNYNNNGKCPPLWSSFQRNTLNFCPIDELPVSGANWKGNKTLPPLTRENRAYKMSFSPNEYFILENRQREGWDRFLPGNGMLIYHVDKNVPGYYMNCANCNPEWMGFDIEEANPSNYYNRSGNTFPGTNNNVSFTDNSNPNSKSNNNSSLGRPIELIKENSITRNISFNFGGISVTDPYIGTTNITKITHDTIEVSVVITPNSSTITERGVLYSTNPIPVSTNNKVISQINNNSFSIPVLFNYDTLYIRAYVKGGNNDYHYGEIIKVIRPCQSISTFPYIHGFESSNKLNNCWSEETNQFISKKWKVIDSLFGSISASQGSNFALFASDSNNMITRKLITPALNINVLSQPYLKFDYYLKQRGNSQEQIRIYYRGSLLDSWQLIKTISNSSNNWVTDSIQLNNKSNTYYIAFEAIANYGYGIGIDNIIVSEGDINAFPSVETIGVNNITDITANIDARVVSQGFTPIVSKGIVWSTSPNPTIEDSLAFSSGSLNNYNTTINNLIPNTIYYIRAFAQNLGLVSYSQDLIIQTKCARISQFPYYHNSETSDTNCVDREDGWRLINSNSNTNPQSGINFYNYTSTQIGTNSKIILPMLNLEYQSVPMLKYYYSIPNGSTDTLKVLYRIGNNDNWITLKTHTNNSSIWILDSIDLPNPSNNYYIAFEAIANNGISINLDNISIHAIFQLPEINTLSANLLTYNSIEVNSQVLTSGLSSVSERGIAYSSTNSNPNINDSKIINGNGIGAYTTNINNLNPETKYYIRAYAKNSYGTNYGQVFNITTPPTPIFNNNIIGNQDLCYNSVTTPISGSQPSGGDGNFTYLWLESHDSINWTYASDEDFRYLPNYMQYRATQTSYFKRIVFSRLVSDTSNIVSKKVYPITKGGNVFRVSDTTQDKEFVKMELRSSVGNILYWERRKENYDWEELPNKNDSVWINDNPNTQGKYYYRAMVKSGGCAEENSGEDWSYVIRLIGLDEIKQNKLEINLSPNPNKGIINLSLNNINVIGDLIIYGINGRIVKEIKKLELKEGNNWIDINPLNSGSYMLVFKTNKNVFSKLIIKE